MAIENIAEAKELIMDYFGHKTKKEKLADSSTDIYNSDLLEWAKYNYDKITEANEDLGTPSDMIKQIQQGQFMANEEMLFEALEEIKKELESD